MKGYIFGLKYKRTDGVSCELARAGFFLPFILLVSFAAVSFALNFTIRKP